MTSLVAAPAVAADPPWIDAAHAAATSVPPKLLAVLTTEVAKAGPEGAIAICGAEAPRLGKAASETTGWQVRRVSLRNRNPKSGPRHLGAGET